MGKAIIGLVALVIGLVIGVFLVSPAMTGAAAGVGIATGLSAGICSTVTAAKEEGLLTDEQVAQILSRATTDMGGEVPEGTDLVGTADDCAGVMERLRAASAE